MERYCWERFQDAYYICDRTLGTDDATGRPRSIGHALDAYWAERIVKALNAMERRGEQLRATA
jgi:hypothetical protein